MLFKLIVGTRAAEVAEFAAEFAAEVVAATARVVTKAADVAGHERARRDRGPALSVAARGRAGRNYCCCLQTHGRRPRPEVGASEAGAEGESFVFFALSF